jgi:TonB family protein
MRYLAAGWIAVLGLGACTEPGRQALGPTADTNCREVTPIAVDSVVDYGARPGPVTEFKIVSRSAPRFPKAVQSSNAMRYAVLSFVIDTGGFVIRSSARIETPPWRREFDDAVCDWLRQAQFEPIRRGGRPVRVAIRNVVVTFSLSQ